MNALLARLSVGEIMTKAVLTVGPSRDVREAASTETDLLRAFVGAVTQTSG
ncbi:MAG TPA: hypothetical protein VET45_15250 [Candidatus Binatia bacterium]|nr:hypothetical protein [Candidatus Binatia bacterium]